MRYLLAVSTLLASVSCVKVDYLRYIGRQDWPTGSAFIREVEGMDVFEGLPSKPYRVIGLIDVYAGDPFKNAPALKKVKQHFQDAGADAMIWLSDRVVSSGSLKMGNAFKEAASLDTGRSSQPEILVTSTSEYTRTSARYGLRSTLLLIQWE